MNVPFSTEQFLSIFEKYNFFVFPFQFLIFIAGLIVLLLIRSEGSRKNLLINYFMVFLWLWNGIIYHILFFSEINPAAYGFGALFIIQSVLFIHAGILKKNTGYEFSGGVNGFIGYFVMVFGLVVYPLLGYFILDDAGKVISLGLPCPSVIFTFGLFILSTGRFPKYLLIIPSIWAVIGFTAVMNFGIYQDVSLLLSAIIADVLLLRRKTGTASANPV